MPSLDVVLVLALDTATPRVVVGIVEIEAPSATAASGSRPMGTRAVRHAASGNLHAETLGLLIPEVIAEAAVSMADVAAVVVGIGPGPFTGLRVGVMTGAALGDALGLPVYGVCTHDAIAATHAAAMHAALTDSVPGGTTLPEAGFAVVTDARRRECYWASYDAFGRRVSGPHVERPADVRARSDWPPEGLVIGDQAFTEALGVEVIATSPAPMGLVLAARGLSEFGSPGPLKPLYLRRPDATPPAPRKPVTPR